MILLRLVQEGMCYENGISYRNTPHDFVLALRVNTRMLYFRFRKFKHPGEWSFKQRFIIDYFKEL